MSQIDTLWYTRCPVPTPLGIASQLGWVEAEFKPDGIHVKTLQDTTDPNLRESHFDHRLDNSFRQGGNIPAIWAKSKGRDTKLIGLTWTDEAQVILVRPDSSIQRVSELRGKKLAVRKNSAASIDFWRATTIRAYVAALGVEGLTEKDVTFIDYDQSTPLGQRGWGASQNQAEQSAEVAAFLAGEVDAIFHKGSRGLELADKIGARVLYDLNTHPDPRVRANNSSPRTFTVDAGLLERNLDLVTRLTKQVLLAGTWAEEHETEAVDYVARETFSSVAAVKRAYGRVNHALKTDLEPASVEALSGFKDFLFQWKFLPNDFDVKSWIDPRPLEAAKAELARGSRPTQLQNAVGA